jgi:glutathione synthase/RimK-type ligase-like ATP-grasp enzyme
MSIWLKQESTRPAIPGLEREGGKVLDVPSIAGTGKSRIGYVVGSDLIDQIEFDPNKDVVVLGSTDIANLRVNKPLDFARIQVTKGYYRHSYRFDLSKFDVLLNQVTDADQHPRVLATMARMLERYGGRVINRPEAVLRTTREQVAQRLQRLPGARIPKVVRLRTTKVGAVRAAISAAEIEYPVIARTAGLHDGKVIGVFHDLESLLPKLSPKQDHYLTEFVDFASADGFYRKYRVFFLGERWFIRHMIVSDRWNVHMADRSRVMLDRPALREEERQVLADPAGRLGGQVCTALRGIQQVFGLDFFGVDFGVTSTGELLLFEANASMNFFPFSPLPEFAYVETCLPPLQRAFEQLLGLDPLAGLSVPLASRAS